MRQARVRAISCRACGESIPETNHGIHGRRRDETILVVEDNAEVRATAVEMLAGLGYKLYEAGNAQQALEQLALPTEIALVFSDIMLPAGMLGSQLEQRPAGAAARSESAMTSGFSESGMVHRGILDGSVELLAKPYKLEDLACRIRARLDGKEENKRVQA